MKKSFSLIELIFVITLVAIISSQIIPKTDISKLNLAAEKIILYLNYTRYISHIDNKYDIEDNEWEKKRWTLKFQRCSSSVGGLYYVVYSDTSGGTAHFKKSETLKDPLTNKYLYSNSSCQNNYDESKYILLTKEYGVTKVDVSRNTTSAIGQISFGYDGKIYSQLGTNPKEILNRCEIKLYDEDDKFVSIVVEPKTGYISKK
ncbi:MAG: type II secretion system protein [Campylobacterota bacterium]|nr:type II secretion system protein [Campylobacterota bacterium]